MNERNHKAIDVFVHRLSCEKVPLYSKNFYSSNKNCVKNLSEYLKWYDSNGDPCLLLGEAPGYRGCMNTGIPFTSLAQLENNLMHELWSKNLFVQCPTQFSKENTSTIVWEVLREISFQPLLWNIYPFHPYKKGKLTSNRKPNMQEIELGWEYLNDLVKIFQVSKIICVGQTAYKRCSKVNWEIKTEIYHVRHPSFGGKKQFKKELFEVLSISGNYN